MTMSKYLIKSISTVRYRNHSVLRVIAYKKGNFFVSLFSEKKDIRFIVSQESPLAQKAKSANSTNGYWIIDEFLFKQDIVDGLTCLVEHDIDNCRKKYENVTIEKNIEGNNANATKECVNGLIEEHESVNLGLPSGNKWAKCNIGASSEEEAGLYLAWGETTIKGKYFWDTYKFCKGNPYSFFKYGKDSKYGKIDDLVELEDEDDAAHILWGSNWHLPTKEDMQELIDYCRWSLTMINQQIGWKVVGRNGNYIFLPAAGSATSSSLSGVNEYGRYWTSTNEDTHSAFNLRFSREQFFVRDDTKFYGRNIRPVYKGKTHSQKNVDTNHASKSKMHPQGNVDLSLNGLCKELLRKLTADMSRSEIYASLETSLKMMQDGRIVIHQEENGLLFNDFVFVGKGGWIHTINIFGEILDAHYRTIKSSMEIFGMPVVEITRKSNCVSITIDQSIFGI